MEKEIADRLDSYVESGLKLKDAADYRVWIRRLLAFLGSVSDPEAANAVSALGGDNELGQWYVYRDRQASHLEGMAIRLRSQAAQANSNQIASLQQEKVVLANKVFIVHGHDTSATESTARFLEKLDLEPIILHEQANGGQTIIEKFEAHANVGFAVVLLTPDDIGASTAIPDKLLPRARQNVILELGYFTGKLGRRRVCGLFRPEVEIPSDFHGVLFIELDAQGGWKAKLAQELVSAGLKINLQGLLQS
ncbi:MAG TPA: nucleotide-binding protein [Thermoanaerobaculia bacterium]